MDRSGTGADKAMDPADLRPTGTRAVVRLTISHVTHYRYRGDVLLNPHRLMLRPRESRLIQVTGFELVLDPPGRVDWAQDVFGNAVATASFDAPTKDLRIASRAEVLHAEPAWPVFPIAASAITYPFAHAGDEAIDLGALSEPASHATDDSVSSWLRGFVAPGTTDTLAMLKDLNAGVFASVAYEAREQYGTQTPSDTLERRRGSCRDLATLLVEAARRLGFGARLVSGYLWDPARERSGSAGPGSTHAWAEIYLPGAGWIPFDPTNSAVGAGHLVPVAAARTIAQIAPVTGGFRGAAEDALDMDVSVQVTAA